VLFFAKRQLIYRSLNVPMNEWTQYKVSYFWLSFNCMEHTELWNSLSLYLMLVAILMFANTRTEVHYIFLCGLQNWKMTWHVRPLLVVIYLSYRGVFSDFRRFPPSSKSNLHSNSTKNLGSRDTSSVEKLSRTTLVKQRPFIYFTIVFHRFL
jgi:hypothetical protein